MRNQEQTTSIGSAGKQLVANLFTRKGYSVTTPARAPRDYIDFTIDNGKNHYDVFVRTDTRVNSTGNIFIERFMYREDTDELERGWLFDGKATMLCYLDADCGNLFFVDWNKLRHYVVEHCRAIRFRNSIDTNTVGDAYFLSVRELEQSGAMIGRMKINVNPLYEYHFARSAPF